MPEPLKDSKVVVQPTGDDVVVEDNNGAGDDKDKNFSELRKQISDKDAIIAAKEAELAALRGGSEPSLDSDEDDEEEENKGKGKPPPVDPLKAVFDRDKREAVRLWHKQNQVTPDVWAKIKSKVVLTGDETVSEIQDKIAEAYKGLPEVQAKREDEIRNEERAKMAREFNDDELDLGGGGSGGDYGGGDGGAPRFNTKERGILDAFGVNAEERKGIDKSKDPNEWEILDPEYKDQ